MTDIELLTLAAKAAGLNLHSLQYSKREFKSKGPALWIVNGNKKSDKPIFWAPITDDGDALRLAVYLMIDIYIDDAMVETLSDNSPIMAEMTDGAHDIFAATRRAIVRTAAEMGRAMP